MKCEKVSNYKKITKCICLKYNKLLFALNNRKIRTKTVYVYVLCVLIPVLVTNTSIIGNMLKVSDKVRQDNINYIADTIAHDIDSSMESAVYVTIDLYASSSICNFLDDQYKSRSDYLQEYNKIFDTYVFYATSKRLISYINFYSDNSTMLNGGRYYRIDSIDEEEWYQKFTQSGEDLFIYSYYNNSNYINQKKRMIAVIRRLNYIGMSHIEKVVKLDLNYNIINDAVKSSAFETTVYVCHEDKIVFCNDKRDKGLKVDYMDASIINQNEVQAHKSLTSYGFDLDIYVTGYKSNYSTMFKSNLRLIVILLLADALIPAIALTLFSDSITKRILLLGRYLKKVKGEKFELISGNEGRDEIGELLDNYNRMTLRMKNLIEYEYRSKLEQQELHLARQQAELLALYSQINPHFMFNVLESIRMHSVLKGEQETSQMIESLAKLMRKSAEWGSDMITIKQEIEFTENYLKLQKYRYGNEFTYKFRINEECYDYMIPSLVLVTFVENSCVHGLDREGHYGTIFILVYEENGHLFMEVEDTGIGMEEKKVRQMEILVNDADIDMLQKTDSLGMLNACIRLKRYCGEQTKIIIESEQQVGTCIIIDIPIENMKKNRLTKL